MCDFWNRRFQGIKALIFYLGFSCFENLTLKKKKIIMTSMAANTMEDLFEISNILNTGLDRDTLSILVNLCEAGVHPEALAAVVKELRREAAAVALEEEEEEENSESTTA